MRRRVYLAAVGTNLAALAGCTGDAGSGENEGTAAATTARESGDGPSQAPDSRAGPDPRDGDRTSEGRRSTDVPSLADVDLPLPRSAVTYATSKDSIPAITDPAFGEDWAGVTIPGFAGDAAEPRLGPEDEVVGVVREGTARAYLLRVMARHEIVNDSLGGPLLVTYCPLCGSAVTAVRRVRGESTIFGVSGKLWRSDLIMYDELTGSDWSQILATAVRGPATGDRLELVPSTLTTWGEWQRDNPDTVVLRPPPESETITGGGGSDYTGTPYEAYEESRLIGVTGERETGSGLHPKTRVLGVTDGDVARAYPEPAVRAAGGVVNDRVGSLPVVVALGPGETLVGYDRRVGDDAGATTLTFTRADERHLLAGRSRWTLLSGEAVDGPYRGTILARASDRPPMYWFAWRDFYPGTERYRA